MLERAELNISNYEAKVGDRKRASFSTIDSFDFTVGTRMT